MGKNGERTVIMVDASLFTNQRQSTEKLIKNKVKQIGFQDTAGFKPNTLRINRFEPGYL